MHWRIYVISFLLIVFSSCVPSRVKELNALGEKAYSEQKYEQAIRFYQQSLQIRRNQPKIRLQLDNAKAMLKQIYVYKIYELVDDKNSPKIDDYLQAWKLSAQLPKLNVPQKRVLTIRYDLDGHYKKHRSAIEAATEPHLLFHRLTQMHALVKSEPVRLSQMKIGNVLEKTHIEKATHAKNKNLIGTELLHTYAAAYFGSNANLANRARTLRTRAIQKLAIDIKLSTSSHQGRAHAHFLLGGVRRLLPEIFRFTPQASLEFLLATERYTFTENKVKNTLSARCKVGSRKIRNTAFPSALRSMQMAKRDYQIKQNGLMDARRNCMQATKAECHRLIDQAERQLRLAKNDYQRSEQRLRRTPKMKDESIYRRFTYERFTLSRKIVATGRVTISQKDQPQRAIPLALRKDAIDRYGEGLACANIAADPLSIQSPQVMRTLIEEKLLQQSVSELWRIARKHANSQLVEKTNKEEELDTLIRAYLIDPSYGDIREKLHNQLTQRWSFHFYLSKQIANKS